MRPRIFISYEDHDSAKVKEIILLQWDEQNQPYIVDRHQSDSFLTSTAESLMGKIKEGIKETAATVVLIGAHTKHSEWVAQEIRASLDKDKPNGMLGIKLHPSAEVPGLLEECGAEIIEWDTGQFGDAIQRAVKQSGLAVRLARTQRTGARGCLRGTLSAPSTGHASPEGGSSAGQEGSGPSAKAIEIACELATEGWRDVAATRLETMLSVEIWPDFWENRNGTICDTLAAAARTILNAKAIVEDAVGNAAASVVAQAGGGTLQCELARQGAKLLIRKIPLPGQADLVATARGLQATGIVICLGTNRIERCRCLADVEEEVGQAALKDALRNAL